MAYPTSVRDVQWFLGLASFYQKFIRHFSAIAAPLLECLKKNKLFWDTEHDTSFRDLKDKLSSTPVLGLPNFSQPLEVAVDPSEIGVQFCLKEGTL